MILPQKEYFAKKKKDTDQRIISSIQDEGYKIVDGIEQRKNDSDNLILQCLLGHQFTTCWMYWRQKHRCPECRNEGLRTPIANIVSAIVSEDYKIDNMEQLSQRKHNTDKIGLICPNGHQYRVIWSNWRQGRRCPRCAVINKSEDNRIPVSQIITAIQNEKYNIVDVQEIEQRENNKNKFTLTCPKQHQFITCWNYWQKGYRCPVCSHRQSKLEREIVDIFSHLSPKECDRTIVSPREIDIYFPDQKVAIEFCGLYWHGDMHARIVPDYHRTKLDKCIEQNIRLLTIFEDEWKSCKDICVSRINNALGLIQDKIYARKCTVKEISRKDAYIFLKQTHIQGPGLCRVAFGLFYNNELVQVMTFGLPSRAHTSGGKKVLEMKRLSSCLNRVIIGGASRLFKLGLSYAKDNEYELIKSYCDLRWGTGNLYKKIGFHLAGSTRYTPHYTDGIKRYRNQSLSQNKKKAGVTELKKTQLMGLWRIYDCGHQTWEYQLK